MIRSFKERRDSEQGFTLIELMVVVLIIGILLAIAVPTFLNAQNNAKTKAATSNLRSALSAVKTVYSDQQTYATTVVAGVESITQTEMKAAEPSLDWLAAGATAAPSTSAEMISWVGTSSSSMSLANRSALGFCFYIVDSVDPVAGGTKYGKSASGDNANCDADNAITNATHPTPKAAGW